jgi:hypothetical protein
MDTQSKKKLIDYSRFKTIQRSRTSGEIKKAITEVAKSYADNITGKVKFGNEAILIVGKK